MQRRLLALGIVAALLAAVVSPTLAQGRIKPEKSKEKGLKRGTIEVKNDTGKECNDFHLFFKPDIPTIEKIKVKGGNGNPFPAGYRHHKPVGGHGGWADWGRQEGDGTVKDGESVVIEIAWKDDMPEIAGYAWTLDGNVVDAAEGAAAQNPQIQGKDADAVRKAEADAQEKARKAAEAAAKKEAEEKEKAEKAAAKKAAKEAKKTKNKEEGVQKSIGGTIEGLIETEAGNVRVILPDDLRAGETITGTVIAEPMGTTAEERRKNAEELNGLVLETGDSKTAVKDRRFVWKVPAGAISLALLLFKPDGTPLRSAMGAVELPQPGPGPDPVGNGGFTIPPAAQTGKPIRISGVFHPAKPTEVLIGGRPAEVLAESPRQSIVVIPRELVGPQEVVVKEDGVQVFKSRVSAINIRLTAAKATLRKGESTTIRVEVSGLQALQYAGDRLEVYFDPAYAIVQNNSPEIIEFFGPGSEPFDGGLILPKPKPTISRSIKITPQSVDSRGIFVRELSIRARQSGSFSISSYFCLEGDFDSISRPTASKSKRPTG